MRTALLGLTVPLLLLAASALTVVPQASAETTTYTVSGIVLSDKGEPLEGVSVNGYTWHEDPARSSMGSNDYTITDADGHFELELAEGRGSINVHYEKWQASDYREIEIDGDVEDLTFRLVTPPPRTAIVTGIVVDGNGDPIEGATVTLQYGCCYAMPAVAEPAAEGGSSANASEGDESIAADEPMSKPAIYPPYYYYNDYQTKESDEDGKFRFEAYGGPRQITAWAKGFAQTTIEVQAIENETVDVEVELLKVPDRTATLEGRIIDSDTGLPIRGATVSARSLEWGRYAEARTDDAGHYELRTVPGWTEISVNFYSWGEPMPLDTVSSDGVATDMIARPIPAKEQYYPLNELIQLEDGDNDGDIALDPKPKSTIVLVGYVVDPTTDKAVEGARVNVWNHEGGDWGEAVTDATGSFKILVRAGHYSGSAWKEGYLSATQTFLVSGEAAQRVDLLMPKGITRWAPCYDDECGPIMYDVRAAEGRAVAGYDASGAPPPAPATSPQMTTTGGSTTTMAPQEEGEEATTRAAGDVDQASLASGPDRSKGAAFEGTGGGLPEYDPNDAGAMPAAQSGGSSSAPVPNLGIVALVAAVGALALLMRRRN